MEKKEFYKRHLPHFQQSGQAYFVTWCLKDAVPPKAFSDYTLQLQQLKIAISDEKSNLEKLNELKFQYAILRKKYIKAFDDLLHLQTKTLVDLSKDVNTKIVVDALRFWEGKRLQNDAFCVMPNHVHWVFTIMDKDQNSEPIYLQDILQSVKRFTANKINQAEKISGTLWHSESFDTTIRNDKHKYNAINYSLNNPVVAGLVENWWEWSGNFVNEDWLSAFF